MAAAPQLTNQLRNTHMTDAEWRARCDLAALYHIVDHFGWTDTSRLDRSDQHAHVGAGAR